jgi:hypothetical protein
VIGVNPDACRDTQAGGVTVTLDPEVFIMQATISPHVLGDEAETLIKVFRSRRQTLKVERSHLAELASEQRSGLEKAFAAHLDRPFDLGNQEFEDASPLVPPPSGLFDEV